jgi:hypothetical protein
LKSVSGRNFVAFDDREIKLIIKIYSLFLNQQITEAQSLFQLVGIFESTLQATFIKFTTRKINMDHADHITFQSVSLL